VVVIRSRISDPKDRGSSARAETVAPEHNKAAIRFRCNAYSGDRCLILFDRRCRAIRRHRGARRPEPYVHPADNGELVGVFTVFVAVGTPQGALSTTFRPPNEARIKSAELKGSAKRRWPVRRRWWCGRGEPNVRAYSSVDFHSVICVPFGRSLIAKCIPPARELQSRATA
jgi:hypothetical protein